MQFFAPTKVNMYPQFCFSNDQLALLPGLAAIQVHFAHRFSKDGKLITFERDSAYNGYTIENREGRLEIRFQRPSQAYRALGDVLGWLEDESTEGLVQQACFLDSIGVMLDVSRNGVFRVERIKELFLQFAFAGVDSVQLYMEDVYLLPDEPYFGYARGAYSESELRQIDDWGHELGIEVIPCIQTLGHLEQILQWPAYAPLQDVRGVVLVGDERVQALIGKMLDFVASCFRSRRVHIGMDEAHGVGSGEYLQKNGYRRPFDILTEHLTVVTALCHQRGLQPMIWSDMFFRIGSETHDYYDIKAVIPDEVAASVPQGVDLVYWDYYHADIGFYEEWIERHRSIKKEPIFALGGWTWGRFWAYWPRLKETIAAGMTAARRKHLKEAFLTLWGDDGTECHPFSILGGVFYFTEMAYAKVVDFDKLERRFALFSPHLTIADCQRASEIDGLPEIRQETESESNFSKWILWHDPVLGFLNPHIPAAASGHYRKLAEELEGIGAKSLELELPYHVARVLALKVRLHQEVREAYRAGDQQKLRELLSDVLPATQVCLHDLWKAHRSVWRHWYKPFGWEVIDRRYGALRARLESLGALLQDYLDNPNIKVEEFELLPNPLMPTDLAAKCYFDYGRVATASAIK